VAGGQQQHRAATAPYIEDSFISFQIECLQQLIPNDEFATT
jgi:hypothetical protein